MQIKEDQFLIFAMVQGLVSALVVTVVLCVMFPGIKTFDDMPTPVIVEPGPQESPDPMAAELEAKQQAEFKEDVLRRYRQLEDLREEIKAEDAVIFTNPDEGKQPLLAPNILEESVPEPPAGNGDRL